MAAAQGTTCAADGATPAQGSPIGCVTGDGVQVSGTSPAETQPEVLPLTPEQRPAAAPAVSYQNGKLTVVAKNSTLGDILRAIAAKTGASIDLPEAANERVVSQLGPAPARDVMAALLNGSHFNYVMVGTEGDPNAVARVVLTAKRERTEGNPTSVASASAMGRPMVQPRTALQAAVMKPYEEMMRQQEEQQAQQAAQSEIQPVESTPEPAVQPVANEAAASNAAPANAGGAEAASVEPPPASSEAPKNANNPGEKTPQQLLQNLYETRRQMMIQQHQPPAPPQP